MNPADTAFSLLSQKASRRLFLGGSVALGALALAPRPAHAQDAKAVQAPASGGPRIPNEIAPPLFDPIASLAYIPGVVRNSWFLIGYLQTADGHRFNCLVHQIISTFPGQPVKLASILNITDITEQKYHGEERVYPEAEVTLSTDRMHVVAPTSTIEGDHLDLHASADFGWGAIELKAEFPGKVMLNGGSGVFSFLGGLPTVQYSIPWGKGSGTISLDGKTHDVTGEFWFDRQFGLPTGIFGQPGSPINPEDNWVWMDLNLSNGVSLGLWDLEMSGHRYSWVTALLPDGTHIVAELEPLSNDFGDMWPSPVSGQRYPTSFRVRVPALDCVLDVKTVMQEQEIVSPTEPKYEGVADVTGTYDGEAITGYTLIEMVGDWRA